MVKKEGEILQFWVENKGYKGREIADMLSIARTSIYNVYKMDKLPNEYKKLLSKEGFDIDIVRKESNKKGDLEEKYESVELLKLEIEHLNQKITMLEQENSFLKTLIPKPVPMKVK